LTLSAAASLPVRACGMSGERGGRWAIRARRPGAARAGIIVRGILERKVGQTASAQGREAATEGSSETMPQRRREGMQRRDPRALAPSARTQSAERTFWMQKAGCSSRKPSRGGREQLVTNMSRSSRCFLSKPSTTLQNISTARTHAARQPWCPRRDVVGHAANIRLAKSAGPACERGGTRLSTACTCMCIQMLHSVLTQAQARTETNTDKDTDTATQHSPQFAHACTYVCVCVCVCVCARARARATERGPEG